MVNLITGDNGANTRTGTGGADVIYGFNPEGPQSNVTRIDATRVATGLTQPLFAGAPEGDLHRLFIVEKSGLIKILNLDTHTVLATPFLNVSGQISDAGEGGLLGLAFDPNFAQNHYFYVDLINTNGDTEVRRYQVSSSDPNKANPASGTPIISVDQPAGLSNHKAGWIDFGPDGYLYVALGDGGGGGDPNANAQNIDSLLGKMLRLDVHGDAFPGNPALNYAIPADNPFVGVDGRDEIWALGLRNPFRDSFDRALGTMYIADVGQGAWEEVDLGQNGANYGWNRYEGPADYNTGTTLGGGTLTAPIHSYDHSVGNVIIGGYAYRGSSEGLQGQYFFADEGAGKLFTLHFNGSSWVATNRTAQVETNVGHIDLLSSFGQDGAGNLYATDLADGEVFRLTPALISSDGADVLRGLAGDDQIYGGSGNDHLLGGSGADFLNGGPGLDYADFSDAGAAVRASLANPAGNTGEAKGDVFVRVEGLIGSNFNDTLTGYGIANGVNATSNNDILLGGRGNDTLNGLSGNDHLFGGPGGDALHGDQGIDTASYSGSAAAVSVDLTRAVQSGGDAQGDRLFSIENVSGSRFADALTGNAGVNNLQGMQGNDLLSGGRGADMLHGDQGTDTASYASSGAAVRINLGKVVQSGGDAQGDKLFSIENVIGSRFADVLVGNAGANTLHGLAGNDVIAASAGADAIFGDKGIDTASYTGSPAAIMVNLNLGVQAGGNAQGDKLFSIENVFGSRFADTLTGNAVANTLQGLAGGDVLAGGTGHDALVGGPGADRFDFNSLSECGIGAARDAILDFNRDQLDKIDLTGIDADSHTPNDQAFQFIGSSPFHSHGSTHVYGELRYANHIVQGDVNGDGTADFEIHVNTAILVKGDFLL